MHHFNQNLGIHIYLKKHKEILIDHGGRVADNHRNKEYYLPSPNPILMPRRYISIVINFFTLFLNRNISLPT